MKKITSQNIKEIISLDRAICEGEASVYDMIRAKRQLANFMGRVGKETRRWRHNNKGASKNCDPRVWGGP
jgi:hypothetical protein